MVSKTAPTPASPFDVLVVGGGHAGCEAAMAAARLGCRTVLVTGAIDRIAAMSCNPAIGGVGKGHLVKEIDALGGHMAEVADATGIQFRTLNHSRGPAVQATRCQSDMERYRASMQARVFATDGLVVVQDDVVGLLVDEAAGERRVLGVQRRLGGELLATAVVLTTGTFLGGRLHLGEQQTPGGRAGEAPQEGLSSSLAGLGLRLGRLKTGTCPRLDGRSIDTDRLEQQPPDDPAPRFAWRAGAPPLRQVSCFITHTGARAHQVIQDAVDGGHSPLFNGQLAGKGPRYCPSVEDKVIRFPHKDSHHLFLEPQGLDTHEVYPNGLSTSLPPEVQLAFVRAIDGLEEAVITRFGYAVAYDFVDPTQLRHSLELKDVRGLFCAGQINGTTGYEEAGIQGLLAGINAARLVAGAPPVVLARHEAYAGVLVDDLVTRGTEEPYRMLTSRAEHRLILREDNAHARLLKVARAVGLVSAERVAEVSDAEADVAATVEQLRTRTIRPTPTRAALLDQARSAPLSGATTLAQLVRRPELSAAHIAALAEEGVAVDETAAAPSPVFFRAVVELKYEGYIARANKEIEKAEALEATELDEAMYAERPPGLSLEVHEKLLAHRPRTLGHASRIPGITPAAVGLLAAHARAFHRRAG
jgi:tRNA uridine 5-carboxymethylaminomethyl modification enzyme